MSLMLSFSKHALKHRCNQNEVERILKEKETATKKNKKNCVFGLSKRNGHVFNLRCLQFIVTGKCMPFCKFNALEWIVWIHSTGVKIIRRKIPRKKMHTINYFHLLNVPSFADSGFSMSHNFYFLKYSLFFLS